MTHIRELSFYEPPETFSEFIHNFFEIFRFFFHDPVGQYWAVGISVVFMILIISSYKISGENTDNESDKKCR